MKPLHLCAIRAERYQDWAMFSNVQQWLVRPSSGLILVSGVNYCSHLAAEVRNQYSWIMIQREMFAFAAYDTGTFVGWSNSRAISGQKCIYSNGRAERASATNAAAAAT